MAPNNGMNRAQALALLGLNNDASARDIKVVLAVLPSAKNAVGGGYLESLSLRSSTPAEH